MSINEWIGSGRLTKDPDVKYTSGTNTAICRFNIAIDRYAKEGEDKKADFIPCLALGKTAENINKFFKKGRKIIIKGRIQTGSWDDADGKKHYSYDVLVEKFDFADSKPAEQGNGGNGQQDDSGFYPVEQDDELPF